MTGAGSAPVSLTVRSYGVGDREPWDALAASARARHFMFQRAYMDYHADRFTDASLVVARGGRVCALLPASRHEDTVISHGGLTFGGLLSGPEMTIGRTREAFEAIVRILREAGVRRLVFKPLPHIYHLGAAEEELVALYLCGARLVRRDVSAAISPAFAPAPAGARRRAAINGLRSGLVLGADGDIEGFLTLVAAVLGEHHGVTPTHTPWEMRLLADRFPEDIRLFTARLEGELLAGVLVYETPTVSHTQYIAASPRGRELFASDALITHLIGGRYSDRWFDFGISNEPDGGLNEGLARYKEAFGARTIAYDRYELILSE